MNISIYCYVTKDQLEVVIATPEKYVSDLLIESFSYDSRPTFDLQIGSKLRIAGYFYIVLDSITDIQKNEIIYWYQIGRMK